MNQEAIKYIHEEDTHNLESPSIIVPHIVDALKPESVVDIGCGIGTFLHEFKRLGVNEVLGLDGKWVDKSKLLINTNEFVEADLELPIRLDKTFDLVLSLEVAEHLSPLSATEFVKSLTRLGKKIVFSAAIENQIGQNHLNEQPFSYWKKLFETEGYIALDFFRPIYWNNDSVQWWYKQNMFLLLHHSIDPLPYVVSKQTFTEENLLIHPDLYNVRIKKYLKTRNKLDKVMNGEGGSILFYLNLVFKRLKKGKLFSR